MIKQLPRPKTCFLELLHLPLQNNTNNGTWHAHFFYKVLTFIPLCCIPLLELSFVLNVLILVMRVKFEEKTNPISIELKNSGEIKQTNEMRSENSPNVEANFN